MDSALLAARFLSRRCHGARRLARQFARLGLYLLLAADVSSAAEPLWASFQGVGDASGGAFFGQAHGVSSNGVWVVGATELGLPRFRRHLHYTARPGISGPFPFSIITGGTGAEPPWFPFFSSNSTGLR